ncbi:MAG: helix-turn-helix domain-containing protein [Desulfobacterales bacterium]|nr:helix-turn-helix domain-containing protein [Desulfobacterales bacterium]
MDIQTPEEVARFLKKSVSWVYKNWKILGGRKLGGSLLFPHKEDLYERLFCEREGMEIRLHPEQKQTYRGLVQDKDGSKTSGAKKKRGIKETITVYTDANRHKLLGND